MLCMVRAIVGCIEYLLEVELLGLAFDTSVIKQANNHRKGHKTKGRGESCNMDHGGKMDLGCFSVTTEGIK